MQEYQSTQRRIWFGELALSAQFRFEWSKADALDLGLDQSLLEQARGYTLTGGGAGYITRGGALELR